MVICSLQFTKMSGLLIKVQFQFGAQKSTSKHPEEHHGDLFVPFSLQLVHLADFAMETSMSLVDPLESTYPKCTHFFLPSSETQSLLYSLSWLKTLLNNELLRPEGGHLRIIIFPQLSIYIQSSKPLHSTSYPH